MADRYWVGGSGTWQSGNTAVWSASPTLTPTGASVPTTSDNVYFTNGATYTVTITATANCRSFTVSAGAPTFNLSTTSSKLTIAGNIDFTGSSAGATITGVAGNLGILLGDTAIPGDWTITSAGRSYGNIPIQIGPTSIAALTWTLQDAFTAGNGCAVQHYRGGFNLNNQTFTCGTITWPNANSKTLDFGSTGKFVLIGNGAVATMLSANVPTTTGDANFVVSYSGATAVSVNVALFASFSFTAGTYTLTWTPALSGQTNNIDFTGFSGTWVRGSATQAMPVKGNLTLSSTMATNTGAGSGAMQFIGTSGTQVITPAGIAVDFPILINTTGATVQLAGALAMNTRLLTLTAGTFDGGGYSITGSAGITMVTGSVTARNINTARAITHTSGTLTFGTSNTTGAYTFNSGTLDLAGYQLNALRFTSISGSVRTLAFGTGNISCSGAGIAWDTTNTTNLTVTGTPIVNINNATVTATTVVPGSLPEASTISFNFTAGTYNLTFLANILNTAKSVNFTGFSGTWLAHTNSCQIYGNLTLSSTMTLTTNTVNINLGSTTSGRTITSNGKIIPFPISFGGVGGSWILQDAVTFTGTSGRITQIDGTLDLNGKTLTLGSSSTSYGTSTGTKNLTFNGGTLVITSVAALAFNNGAPTGYTTTAGVGVGKISMTGASGKTFEGGGSTYNCTVSNDGAGLLTLTGDNAIQTLTTTSGNISITGNNTIETIANAVQPVTFTFTAGTTQTITNWNVSGTSGNLVTILSSAAGSPATLSKSSGAVSANYLSLKDSAATGGAAWYAGANSVNVSGNSGWIFTGPPAGNTGAFFFLF